MRDRPRILLLTNSLAVGGSETQLVRLAVHLRSVGHPVLVATILPDGGDRPELRAAGIRHEVLPLRRPIGAITVLAGAVRLLHRWRPDVVVSFLFYANVLGRVAGALARTPVVVSSVRNERFGGRVSDAALRLTDRLASVTVTNARTAAGRLVADRIVSPSRMRVIPNVAPAGTTFRDVGRDEVRRTLGIPSREFLWVAVGRLEPQKGYPVLLHALRRLREAGARAHLLIAGDGSERHAVRALVEDLGLGDHVRLLGQRRDVDALLAASDALVLASLWEGMPNVVIEAFTAGLPVVATSCGGTPEIVDAGVTGLLVSPGDASALSDAMVDLMGRAPAARSAMGAEGRRRVMDRFGPDDVMARWDSLLAELTVGHRSATREPRAMGWA